MRKWFAFDVGGVTWTAYIAKRSEFDAESQLDGLSDPSVRRIYICDEFAEKENAQSACEAIAMHEIEHAFNEESGASQHVFKGDKDGKEELHINMTSPLRYSLYKRLGLKFPRLPRSRRHAA